MDKDNQTRETSGAAKLLPCAHCGSTATEMSLSPNRWYIECDNCGIQTPTDNFGDPLQRWNTRAESAVPEASEEGQPGLGARGPVTHQ